MNNQRKKEKEKGRRRAGHYKEGRKEGRKGDTSCFRSH